MQIACKIKKIIHKDEYTGYTLFSAVPKPGTVPVDPYGSIRLEGFLQPLPPGFPLLAECIPANDSESCTEYLLQSYLFAEGKDGSELEEFLASSSFPGIGPVKAREIVKKYPDVFLLAGKEDAVDIFRRFGLSAANATKAVQRLREIYTVKSVSERLLRWGGSFSAVLTLCHIFGEDTEKEVTKNPYLMQIAGVPFSTCEFIAKEQGIGQYDKKRLSALVKTAHQLCLSGGHTKVLFSALCQKALQMEKKTGLGYQTSPFFLASLLPDRYEVRKEEGQYFVYSKKDFETEEKIAFHVRRLAGVYLKKPISREEIHAIETETELSYSPEQKEAFQLLDTPGVKILTGGPGTGKTTIINGLIKLYKKRNPSMPVVLCAPTGCAAKRLSVATDMPAKTIHRLLGVRPIGTRFIQDKDENCRLDRGLLIVDENSMTDEDLFLMLLSAVETGSTVLLCGDEDQLQPVGKGSVLHDLLAVEQIPKCRLIHVFRQEEESLIIRNSIRIREGNPLLETGSDYEIIRCETVEQMQNALLLAMETYYEKDNPDKTKVYSPVRKEEYSLGTESINRLMQEYFNPVKDAETVLHNGKRFAKGDPVIFMANNYEKGYMNGDTGVVTGVLTDGQGSRQLCIQHDGEEMFLSGGSLQDVEPAYAITAHKSQGGECDIAILVLPEKPANMLTRSLVYVATTRARKKNIILSQGFALESAIRNKKKEIRFTGLRERLRETFSN